MIGRLKFDITGLVNEMLDQLPASVWTSSKTTFLDPCMGGGQFVAEIERRLREAGHSKLNIRKRVFGFENNQMRVNYAINKHKLVGTYRAANFLEMELSKHFDVVLGNPPYLKGTWHKFLLKGLDLSPDYLCQISPDGTNNFSSRSSAYEKLLLDNGIQQYVECTSYFPGINSGKICYLILEPNRPAIPESIVDDSITGRIVRKYINYPGVKIDSRLSGKRDAISGESPRYDSPQIGCIKTLQSVSKTGSIIKYVAKDAVTVVDGNEYWFTNRYYGKDSESPLLELNEYIGISSNILVIKKIPGMSIEEFKKITLTAPKMFVLGNLGAGSFDTSPRHLKQLSVVDDGDIDLTQEEIDYIEANVK